MSLRGSRQSHSIKLKMHQNVLQQNQFHTKRHEQGPYGAQTWDCVNKVSLGPQEPIMGGVVAVSCLDESGMQGYGSHLAETPQGNSAIKPMYDKVGMVAPLMERSDIKAHHGTQEAGPSCWD